MSRQPLALGTVQGRSKPLTASRVINLYFEPGALNSRAPHFQAGPFSTVGGPLYGTPGIRSFTMHAASTVRCMRQALGYLYVLVGGVLYREDQSGNQTICTGDVIPPTGNAMMTDNGVQLTVLSSGLCFVVVGTVIAQITAAAYPTNGVGSIDTIDGYTLFSSNVLNGNPVFGPAVVITNATQADPCVITAVAHGFPDNSQVFIEGVVGMTQLNNQSFTILGVDVDNFQLVGIDSTGFDAYTSDGTAQQVIAQGNGQWFVSALYNSAELDPLQFATAETKPDPLLRIIVVNREIWLFGSQSIEPWTNSGGSATSTFPFSQVTGSVMDRGTAAALSPAELTGNVFWLGDDLVVYMATAYTPIRISNFSIEEFLRQAAAEGTVADAYGMTYTQAGHSFYVLTLPTAQRTFVFDITNAATTPVWHERKSGTQLTPSAWAVTCIVPWNQTIYCGTTSGTVGILDLDTPTELGQPIRSACVTPPLYNDGKRAEVPILEIECELGVGTVSGQGLNPKVMVRWSDDGGATWSNEREAALGLTGDRIDRALVRRMGIFRQREYEFSISDPVKRAFYGMRYSAVSANA